MYTCNKIVLRKTGEKTMSEEKILALAFEGAVFRWKYKKEQVEKFPENERLKAQERKAHKEMSELMEILGKKGGVNLASIDTD